MRQGAETAGRCDKEEEGGMVGDVSTSEHAGVRMAQEHDSAKGGKHDCELCNRWRREGPAYPKSGCTGYLSWSHIQKLQWKIGVGASLRLCRSRSQPLLVSLSCLPQILCDLFRLLSVHLLAASVFQTLFGAIGLSAEIQRGDNGSRYLSLKVSPAPRPAVH